MRTILIVLVMAVVCGCQAEHESTHVYVDGSDTNATYIGLDGDDLSSSGDLCVGGITAYHTCPKHGDQFATLCISDTNYCATCFYQHAARGLAPITEKAKP